jgi:hypothetical protein
MKRQRKKANVDGREAARADGLGPTEVARLARISVGLASRKLRAGVSASEIIEQAENRRRQQTLRLLPSVPLSGTNGGVGDEGITFAEAQRRKEAALARLRQLEVGEKSNELVPVADIRNWMVHLCRPLVGALRALPGELRGEIDSLSGAELERLLRERIEGILGALVAYLDSCFERAGKPLSDGALTVGGYKVRWWIEPPPKDAA